MVGIGSISEYAYTYGFISALPTPLDYKEYEHLVMAKGTEEILLSLSSTIYGEKIKEFSKEKTDVVELQNLIVRRYVEVCKEIVATMPSDIRDSAKALVLGEFDIQNLKAALRGVTAGEASIDFLPSTIPEDKLKEVLSSAQIAEAVGKIQKLGYDVKADRLFDAEFQLDIELLKMWATESAKIKEIRDTTLMQIDMVLIKLVIKSKMFGIDIAPYLESMPRGEYLREVDLKAMVQSAGYDSLLDILEKTPYADRSEFKNIIKNFKNTKSIERFEIEVEKVFADYIVSAQPLTLNFIITYLRRMKVDMYNLKVVLIAKEHNLEPDEIRGLLIGVYKAGEHTISG